MIDAAPRSTFALKRIDRLTGRVFTLGTILMGSELVIHAFEQREALVPVWFWLSLSFLVAAQLYNLINFWFLKRERWPYLLHGLAYLFAFATWSLQVGPVYLIDQGVNPWIWSAVGPASIAVGMYVPRFWALAYMAAVPVGWTLLHISPAGGSEHLDAAITDGIYSALFPGALVALVWMLRAAALRADHALDESLARQIDEVSKETQFKEQSRIDSIVYTSVFDALKSAAKAKNASEYELALQASKESLERIEAAKRPQPEEVSTMSLFETLERIVAKVDPKCALSIKGSSLTFIPKEVATALSDAAVQALNNSLQHAGIRAERKVHLRSTKHGVKLVISDNGIGFRPSKVPDQSLGFRYVIIRRVESVGGIVHIDSSPANGTQIILEWEVQK
ncbi:MAG: hypothetical protein ORN27_01385 [Rhodoluna sp.]|nr:hypothetical protein [Rhodoluna sp.]